MMREKNWWKEHRTGIRNALIGAAVIGVAVGGWGTYSMYRNRRMTELMIEARNQERVQQNEEKQPVQNTDEIPIAPGQKEEQTADPRDLNLMPVLTENPVIYQGATYRRNQYVKAILCMGVDRSDTMTESKEFGAAGQSDGIFLIAQDTVHHSLKILMIPRDTMTEIPITNDNGAPDTKITQLRLRGYRQPSQMLPGQDPEGRCSGLRWNSVR
jgi:polyisoprenyl-teichoic acid--peptidoglycan teichoic acid transferase